MSHNPPLSRSRPRGARPGCADGPRREPDGGRAVHLAGLLFLPARRALPRRARRPRRHPRAGVPRRLLGQPGVRGGRQVEGPLLEPRLHRAPAGLQRHDPQAHGGVHAADGGRRQVRGRRQPGRGGGKRDRGCEGPQRQTGQGGRGTGGTGSEGLAQGRSRSVRAGFGWSPSSGRRPPACRAARTTARCWSTTTSSPTCAGSATGKGKDTTIDVAAVRNDRETGCAVIVQAGEAGPILGAAPCRTAAAS